MYFQSCLLTRKPNCCMLNHNLQFILKLNNFLMSEPPPITKDTLQPFLDLCEIQTLSASVTVEHITPMFQPCNMLQLYVHRVTPFIQRYLWSQYPDIYQQQIESDIVQRLKKLQCVQVGNSPSVCVTPLVTVSRCIPETDRQ